MRSIPTDSAGITLGVDTHKDFHVAVALDGLGRRLGTLSIPTTPAGYEELVDYWANGLGPLEGVGIEGTGSFGAGLARFLQAPRGQRSWRWFVPSAVSTTAAVSPIP
jgi:transposase